MPPARTTREAEVLALLASGLSKHRPLNVTFAAVGHDQAYFRSLYLRAKPSARLRASAKILNGPLPGARSSAQAGGPIAQHTETDRRPCVLCFGRACFKPEGRLSRSGVGVAEGGRRCAGAGTRRLGHFGPEFRRRGVACASRALEVGPVELAECFPVPGIRFGVVGRVIGHRESVAGGVELEGVIDSSVSERAFQ